MPERSVIITVDKFGATIWRNNVGMPGERIEDQSISTKVESISTSDQVTNKSIPAADECIPTTEEKVYQLIKEDPKNTKEKMSKVLTMSKPRIKKNIDKLIAVGKIKRIGTFGL